MSKTTVVIDDRLLDEAMKARGLKITKEAITAGLKELIGDKRLTALREVQYQA